MFFQKQWFCLEFKFLLGVSKAGPRLVYFLCTSSVRALIWAISQKCPRRLVIKESTKEGGEMLPGLIVPVIPTQVDLCDCRTTNVERQPVPTPGFLTPNPHALSLCGAWLISVQLPQGRRWCVWLIEEPANMEKPTIAPREKTGKIKQASSFPSVCNIHLNIYLEQIHFNEFSVKLNQLIKPRLRDQKCKMNARSDLLISASGWLEPRENGPCEGAVLFLKKDSPFQCVGHVHIHNRGAWPPSRTQVGKAGLREAESLNLLCQTTESTGNKGFRHSPPALLNCYLPNAVNVIYFLSSPLCSEP